MTDPSEQQIDAAARALYERPNDRMAQEHPWAEVDRGVRDIYLNDARAALAAATVTITTTAEMDALPVGSVVLDRDGEVARNYHDAWFVIVAEGDSDPWLSNPCEADDLVPATLLYRPPVSS